MAEIKTILKSGFSTSWKNKKFWLFGIFVSLVGTAGEIEILFKSNELGNRSIARQLVETVASTRLFTLTGLLNSAAAIKNNPIRFLQVILILTLIIGIIIILFWFVAISHGALIHGISQAQAQRGALLPLSARVGITKFWPLFWLIVAMKICIGASLFLLGKLLFQNAILFVAAFVLVFLLILFIHVAVKYTACAITIENMGLVAGIKKGFSVFWQDRKTAFTLAGFLFLINIIAILALALGIFLILTPFFLIFGTSILFQAGSVFIFNVYLAALIILGLILLVSSAVTTFHWACWTKLYLKNG